MHIKRFNLWLVFFLCGFSSAIAEETANEKTRLQMQVDNILRRSNVDIRSDVEKVFTLGDIYLAENNQEKALYYYLEGLKSDTWNLPYQLKAAKLLQQSKKEQQATEKAKLVYEYAEKQELIEEAESILKELNQSGTKGSNALPDSSVAVMLVPIGNINRYLLNEAIEDLQNTLGIRYVINDDIDIQLGKPERSHANQYINNIFDNMRGNFTDEQFKEYRIKAGTLITDLEGYENRKNFVITVLKENEVPEEKLIKFQEALSTMEKEGQYHATTLIYKLLSKAPPAAGPFVKGCVGITGEDIYDSDYNFLFGQAMGPHAVMSYHRFTAEFNDEIPNRQRLKDRTVRQLISSSFLVFNIPRCSNPTCARAYPNSMEEHDRKNNTPCPECLEKWKKAIGRN